MLENLTSSWPRALAVAVACSLALGVLAAAPPAQGTDRHAAGEGAREAVPDALERRGEAFAPKEERRGEPASSPTPEHLADAAPKLAEEARARAGEAFGGVWIDGDRLVVGHTDAPDAQAQARAAAASVGIADDADTVTVEFSAAELETAHEELHAATDELAARSVRWHSIGTTLPENRVIVSAPAPTAGLEAAIADLVSEPGAVRVEAGPGFETLCDRYDCTSGPIRAGLEIWMPHSGGSRCTMAFPATLSGVGEGVLTAGHCLNSWEEAAHSNYWFGQARQTHFYNGSHADAVFVRMYSGWNATNWVYRNAWNPSHSITSVGNGGWQGQQVCFSGRTTNGEVCGAITATGVTINYGSVTLYNQNIFNGCAQPGDSGSPVYTLGGTAQGILSGGSTDPWGNCGGDVIYTPIDSAQSATGATVRTWP